VATAGRHGPRDVEAVRMIAEEGKLHLEFLEEFRKKSLVRFASLEKLFHSIDVCDADRGCRTKVRDNNAVRMVSHNETAPAVLDKGKPVVRRGRKAMGS
jgi:hypothetical protein